MKYCSIFESTIRYLGGLISAYELSGKQYPVLVQKAQQLADRLSLGWSRVSVFESEV
jgi:mannosyl-oligosaccharide alpha-1,2-mannosidase